MSWSFVSVLDACGYSGGTLVSGNPLLDDLKAFETYACILLTGKLKGLNITVHVLNIYGPYYKKLSLWDRVKSSGILSLHHLIRAGDINFTWFADEVWGSGRNMDPLLDYLSSLFDEAHILDIVPIVISPTWSNGRCGPAGIAK